jgi:hypothetical protein
MTEMQYLNHDSDIQFHQYPFPPDTRHRKFQYRDVLVELGVDRKFIRLWKTFDFLWTFILLFFGRLSFSIVAPSFIYEWTFRSRRFFSFIYSLALSFRSLNFSLSH